MDKWDEWCLYEAEIKQIGDVLDGNGLILFFRRGDDLFGAGEDSRLTFARMKGSDDEDGESWRNDARFLALNLMKTMMGEPGESLFSMKDLPGIKIIDRDEAVTRLHGKKKAPEKKKKK